MHCILCSLIREGSKNGGTPKSVKFFWGGTFPYHREPSNPPEIAKTAGSPSRANCGQVLTNPSREKLADYDEVVVVVFDDDDDDDRDGDDDNLVEELCNAGKDESCKSAFDRLVRRLQVLQKANLPLVSSSSSPLKICQEHYILRDCKSFENLPQRRI